MTKVGGLARNLPDKKAPEISIEWVDMTIDIRVRQLAKTIAVQ